MEKQKLTKQIGQTTYVTYNTVKLTLPEWKCIFEIYFLKFDHPPLLDHDFSAIFKLNLGEKNHKLLT